MGAWGLIEESVNSNVSSLSDCACIMKSYINKQADVWTTAGLLLNSNKSLRFISPTFLHVGVVKKLGRGKQERLTTIPSLWYWPPLFLFINMINHQNCIRWTHTAQWMRQLGLRWGERSQSPSACVREQQGILRLQYGLSRAELY